MHRHAINYSFQTHLGIFHTPYILMPLHRMCAKGHQLATALYSLARLELNGLVSTWQDPTSHGAGFDKNVPEYYRPQQVASNSGILRLLQILNMIHSDQWLYRAVLLHDFDIF